MHVRESKRARELRETLAEKFAISPEVVNKAAVAFVTAVHDRLPRGTKVALLSWVPDCMMLLMGSEQSSAEPPARGIDGIKARIAAAGVPDEVALRFVVELVRFLGDRCGTPIADGLRKKIPELAELEQQAPMTGDLFPA
jgi:hypothetical protein